MLTLNQPDSLIMPMKSLYHLSSSTFYEYSNNAQLEDTEPKIIYLRKGDFTINSLASMIANDKVIERLAENHYLLHLPIYIAHNATLVVDNTLLKLDVKSAPFIIYNGKLLITNSEITSWDKLQGNYGPRPKLSDKQLLTFGKQQARPYLLGLHGSNTLIKYSLIRGLGYQGPLSPFGISFNGKPKTLIDPLGYDALLNLLAPPSGELIGNVFEHNFMGVYSNFAKHLNIKGNIIRYSTLYNIDPHDASSDLNVENNIVYGAKHSHGIIFSREVNDSRIINNIVFNNHGSGIMLDRASNHNQIRHNLIFLNGKSGISIYESANNLITDNTVLLNDENGVIVRNSQSIEIHRNTVEANQGNGIEVLSRSLHDHTHRDFNLDPYNEISSVNIHQNRITENHVAAISAKYKYGLSLFKNNTSGSAPYIYGGDLSVLSNQIIAIQDAKPFIHCSLNLVEEQCPH
ncbi:right-handed parallel beta-helix repeat-containing protein [Pseudoalteromonas sp.]|uniref:right-handed parallel beta-helix repeat-containing protein n=1 Tax=Pseudoalteromonas sp. TaxID=53249 RepID=UPI0035683600